MSLLKSTKGFFAAIIVLILVVTAVVYKYILWVDAELWKKNIAFINEATYQQAETITSHIVSMQDVMERRRKGLAMVDSTQRQSIERMLFIWKDKEKYTNSFIVGDESSIIYTGNGFDKTAVRAINRKAETGFVPPHLCTHCGQRVINFYQRISTRDGKKGYLVTEVALSELMSRITDNFYNGQGVSYITDTSGMVLMRPMNEDSGRTLSSFIDILRENDNPKDKVDTLRDYIQGHGNGYAVLKINDESNLIYYRPIKGTDWMLISIVPESALAAETMGILNRTFVMLIVIMAALMIAFGLLFYSERLKKQAQLKELQTHAELKLAEEKNMYMANINAEQEKQMEQIQSLNEQLQEKQLELEDAVADAEKANRAKSDFLSRMSHDIRTPINAVVGMTEIAKRNLASTERLKDCLNKISLESTHLQILINDILDLSAIESGKLTIKPEGVCLEDVIARIDLSVRALVETKALSYSCEQGAVISPYVKVDVLRLSQIYMNLLSNAVKYTPEGGRVKLELWQTAAAKPGFVELHAKINDTGIGMSKEFMQNMYSEFARAVDTRVNKIQGSGLGLAIVKRIVDMMRGRIEVESELNKGTSFHVILPLEAVDGIDIQAKQTEAVINYDRLKGLKVLVAEDNDINYEIVKVLLSEYGIEVTRAENGAVVLERLQQGNSYDIILMDMQMPVMNGIEATKTVRALPDEAVRSIPIIAMTANAFAEDMKACLDVGMNAHCAKPVNVKILLDKIQRLLGK